MHGRRVDRTFKTYNQQDIRNWIAEIDRIPGDIEQIRKLIQSHQQQLDIYEPQLQKLKTDDIMPLEQIILGLQSQINVLTIPATLFELEQKTIPYSDKLTQLKPNLEDERAALVTIEAEINQLRIFIKIAESRQAEDTLLSEIGTHLEHLGRLQKELHEANTNELSIKNQITSVRSAICEARSTARPVDGVCPTVKPTVVLESELAELEQKRTIQANKIADLERKLSARQAKQDAARTQLDEHKNKIRSLEREVQGLNALTTNITLLKSKLETRLSERTSLQIRKDSLESEYSSNKRQLDNLRHEIAKLKSDYERALLLCTEFSTNLDINDLKRQLRDRKADRMEIGKEETRLGNIISGHKSDIEAANESIRAKVSHRYELNTNTFMVNLRDQPEILLNDFIALVRKSFENYDETHPINQPDNHRLCLMDAVRKLNSIEHLNDEAPKLKYYQLCGMIWEMLDKVDSGPNIELAEIIVEIFKEHPVDEQEAKSAYQALRLQNVDKLRDLDWSNYLNLEKDAHEGAYRTLDTVLTQLTYAGSSPTVNLRKCGFDLLNALNNLKRRAENKDDHSYDYKFYTQVLDKTTALVRDPGNVSLREKYHRLVDANTDGQPSMVKKVSGSMAMLMGAAAIAAKFALDNFPIRVSTPIALAGGGLAFVFGMGLFSSGMQKGTSSKMAKVVKSAEKASKASFRSPRSGH